MEFVHYLPLMLLLLIITLRFAASRNSHVMRCYLAATLILGLLFTATGNLMAQSQPEVLCERTEFGHNLLIWGPVIHL